jgi:hypothetical protein
MASIAKDIASKEGMHDDIAIEIVEGKVDNVSYEVESKRGLNTKDERITARHKNRDRRNLGKEKSNRMHDKLTAKYDKANQQRNKRANYAAKRQAAKN